MELHKKREFVVRADFFGDISSGGQKSFWLPQNKGVLYFSGDKICYKPFGADKNFLEVDFKNIIKVKMLTLNPRKNHWSGNVLLNPFYFMAWNPFWNRFLINITYIREHGQPREVFLKLKTKKITEETIIILKKLLTESIV